MFPDLYYRFLQSYLEDRVKFHNEYFNIYHIKFIKVSRVRYFIRYLGEIF